GVARSMSPIVSDQPKPATDYQLKTGHFEEAMVRQVGFPAFLLEDRYGESTRNGGTTLDYYALEAGLVVSANSPDAGDPP
ncbi:MAG: hypothetical protein ACK2T2_03510, partial [Anaerolineales bacterium]